ncbi:MAG: hypothetical protein M0R47_18930 [Methylobacter sp.]|uniref:hypothetical protein n=1 Tax=Methylobacter sp. TaxID=2051955 RepID=UPI0025DD2963|nr:hypothetical protein [Methylobacter sp.]MCK9622596.1 hypothetical protein [Methylobacter sp.]
MANGKIECTLKLGDILLNNLVEENQKLKERIKGIEESLQEMIYITDRDHDVWIKAKKLLGENND